MTGNGPSPIGFSIGGATCEMSVAFCPFYSPMTIENQAPRQSPP